MGGMRGALFLNSSLDRAAIVDASLQGARIIATSLDNVNLNGPCDMSGIYIANSTFRGAFFPGGALFHKAHLVLAEFANANLFGTSFRGATITDSIFDHANIDHADFRGVVGFEK